MKIYYHWLLTDSLMFLTITNIHMFPAIRSHHCAKLNCFCANVCLYDGYYHLYGGPYIPLLQHNITFEKMHSITSDQPLIKLLVLIASICAPLTVNYRSTHSISHFISIFLRGCSWWVCTGSVCVL